MGNEKSMQTRRDFLKSMGVVGGGLILNVSLSGCATPFPHTQDGDFEPNAWLQITPQNDIIFYLNSVEMGQGTMTGMTTLIAEELNTEPHLIEVKSAGVHPDFVNPVYGVQITGGSTSTAIYYDELRMRAAQAREMIRAVAALQLHVSADQLDVCDGHILHGKTKIPFGQFVHSANQLPIPDVELKPQRDYRFIGKPSVRLDSVMKAMGTAKFGIDTQLPELNIAVVKRCPVIGGSVKDWQANGADSMSRVKSVVAIPNGVAVVAESFWHAQQALKKVTVNWELPELAEYSSDDIRKKFSLLAETEEGRSAFSKGNVERAMEDSPKVFSAHYSVPYLAHATMEPMNCTVVLSQERCDIWVPTQVPPVCASIAEEVTGLRRSQINVHTTLVGGGFGRRLSVDYVIEATHVAKASGLPVKLIFSREDDMQNDYYRPAAHSIIKASLNHDNEITGWYQKNVNPNILPYAFQEVATAVLPAWLPDGLVRGAANMGPFVYGKMLMDPASTEGAIGFGYDSASADIRHVQADPGLRTGYWRSVGHSFNGFVVESFIDEVAFSIGKDPLQFRLDNLTKNSRLSAVLEKVAKKGSWGRPLVEGASQGVAVHESFGSYVAQLVEVSIQNNEIKTHRVTVAIDCGKIINPDIVAMQMEGGIIFGLTACLKGEITLKDGMVQQANFDDYPLLRIDEAPLIDVYVVESNEDSGGAGEPGVPPIAAAVANAVFAATGERLRDLPFRLT